MTPGKRPVMEIAGIGGRLIGWQSTRRQQIADVMSALVADYEKVQGHPPGERAAYALDRKAADGSRSPKPSTGWRRGTRAPGARSNCWGSTAVADAGEAWWPARAPGVEARWPRSPGHRAELLEQPVCGRPCACATGGA
ncbi:hypothetical protein [Streptomyces sp. NPDC051364]|uniref:hypothetical protein n=1 Tax=Streptomyces sp. NPDC051364 TaxID=3155799 RepID=UPI003438D951